MNKQTTQSVAKPSRDELNQPLVVITGPTASGKSSVALQIATDFDGEIICADSRTIYKYMDIGTTKPSLEDQAVVPHWGLDLVEPGEAFSAADFKKYAEEKIAEIRSRGKLPMLVGGTGLYIESILFDYQFAPAEPKLRQKLEAMSVEELKLHCRQHNMNLPENDNNKRYIVRAIERQNTSLERLATPIPNVLIVGITTDRETLKARIATRAEQLFESGMVEEAIMLGKKYGWESEAMTGNIYKLIRRFLAGELDETELKQASITSDWHLAKKQLTFLKRNKFITWLKLDEVYSFISSKLS